MIKKIDKSLKGFCERAGFEIKDDSPNGKYIYLKNPFALIRLAGYLKFRPSGRTHNIFLRGQTKDHPPGTVPSLFHGTSTRNEREIRIEAYDELLLRLTKHLRRQSRFQREKLGSVLQHYGIKTPWIDLVDNLFIALWFATQKRSEEEPYTYQKSQLNHGWIYFVKAEATDNVKSGMYTGKKMKWCDLRIYHTSLNLRLHTQHGISLSRRHLTPDNYNLNEFVAAAVKLPIQSGFAELTASMEKVPMNYLFPNENSDDTYRRLKDSDLDVIIRDVEEDKGLEAGSLGKIDRYQL